MNAILRPPFPEVVDSTIIAAARSCGRKVFLEFFEHWKGKEPNVHLHAGAAYAKGLEVARRSFFEQGKSDDDAQALGLNALLEAYGDFQCPSDSAKSAERTAGAYAFYHMQYPMTTDKARLKKIEFSFVEPIDVLHPETGNPMQYCGRMDAIVQWESMLLGLDDKTTSQLGASWPRQWDLRSQFTGYVWGASKSAGMNLNGFLVRGVSILKTKYDTLQAITYRPEWQIERWYAQMCRDVERMKEQWASGEWDYNLDHACNEYGGCPFRQVCLTNNPSNVLESLYERRKWDPILRIETRL